VYWSVSESALEGVVDQIRTRLVELASEMRVDLPTGSDQPSAEAADRAVGVVIHGDHARVNIASAVAGDQANQSVRIDDRGHRSEGRSRALIYAASIATIVGVLVAIAQWQGWRF